MITQDETRKRQEILDEYYRVAAFAQAYDAYVVSIKTWNVTVTAIALTAGFSQSVAASRLAQCLVFAMTSLLAGTFWMTEVIFKMFQHAHVRHVQELEEALNSGKQVETPAYLSAFMRHHEFDGKNRVWLRVARQPAVMLPHAVLVVLSAILFFVAAIK